MEFHNLFLGPMTAATAAGIQPMGSVFNAVPAPASILARNIPHYDPPAALPRPDLAAPVRDRRVSRGALPCGCCA